MRQNHINDEALFNYSGFNLLHNNNFGTIRVDYSEFSKFNFSIATNSFSDDNEIYYYKLEGYSNSWDSTSSSQISFNNLLPNDYRLVVKSKVNDQFSNPIGISFKVSPPYYQTWWFRILIVATVLVFIYVFLKMRTNHLIKKQYDLEKIIIERTEEVVLQKDKIEEAHKEITDSIAYAKRIQSAILPPRKVVKEYLQKSFILYKPKDIVAGDFYWLEHKENKVLFAAADCTGHGVPGAMVSVVCNNALNRCVREYGLTDPGEILDKTREIVIQEFEKSEEDVKDGMDIALCSLEGSTLKYAGAHNPLWIIRNGEIIETKANKQPIGKFDKQSPYTTHSFDLEAGDAIYIFSDGYVDQFGGEKGKKFKAKAFRSLLLSIQDKVMEEQKVIIDNAFEAWRGSLEQIDDVCVIGVRV